MDTKKLKQAAGALRIWIDENRSKHRQALKGYRENGRYRGRDAHEALQVARARLEYLVPLYRGLLAASQQSQTVAGGEKGAKVYLRRFRALQTIMEKVVLYPNHGFEAKYFGDDLLNYPLLVPDERAAPGEWQFRKISELLADVRAELEAKRQAQLSLARNAESARKAFLHSLTQEQRVLLNAALETAKAKGTHAIYIDARDLGSAQF
jgi:hypothetical protein